MSISQHTWKKITTNIRERIFWDSLDMTHEMSTWERNVIINFTRNSSQINENFIYIFSGRRRMNEWMDTLWLWKKCAATKQFTIIYFTRRNNNMGMIDMTLKVSIASLKLHIRATYIAYLYAREVTLKKFSNKS